MNIIVLLLKNLLNAVLGKPSSNGGCAPSPAVIPVSRTPVTDETGINPPVTVNIVNKRRVPEVKILDAKLIGSGKRAHYKTRKGGQMRAKVVGHQDGTVKLSRKNGPPFTRILSA